ncbi:MAG: hypothetical protein AAFW47_05560 [Pseudomonadota bacterium]
MTKLLGAKKSDVEAIIKVKDMRLMKLMAEKRRVEQDKANNHGQLTRAQKIRDKQIKILNRIDAGEKKNVIGKPLSESSLSKMLSSIDKIKALVVKTDEAIRSLEEKIKTNDEQVRALNDKIKVATQSKEKWSEVSQMVGQARLKAQDYFDEIDAEDDAVCITSRAGHGDVVSHL